MDVMSRQAVVNVLAALSTVAFSGSATAQTVLTYLWAPNAYDSVRGTWQFENTGLWDPPGTFQCSLTCGDPSLDLLIPSNGAETVEKWSSVDSFAKSLQSDARFKLSGGTLSLADGATLSWTFTLSGGVLKGGQHNIEIFSLVSGGGPRIERFSVPTSDNGGFSEATVFAHTAAFGRGDLSVDNSTVTVIGDAWPGSIAYTTFKGNGRVVFDGTPSTHTIDARLFEVEIATVENRATINLVGAIGLSFGGTFNNYGTLSIIPDGSATEYGKLLSDVATSLTLLDQVPNFKSGALNNQAGATMAFLSPGGFAPHTVRNIEFNNAGLVSIGADTFVMFENVHGAHSGKFGTLPYESLNQLEFRGGDHTFTTPDSGIHVFSFTHSGGTLDGGNHSWISAWLLGNGIQKGPGESSILLDFLGSPHFSRIDDYTIDGRQLSVDGYLNIGGTLTLANGATLVNKSYITRLFEGSQIRSGGGASGKLENRATVLSEGEGSAKRSLSQIEIANLGEGRIAVTQGATLEVLRSQIENSGVIQVDSSSRMTLLETSLHNLSGSVLDVQGEIDGEDSEIVNAGTFLVQGKVTAKSIHQIAGTLAVDGELWGSVEHTGGQLIGGGVINGDSISGGGPDEAVFNAGHSPGSITVNGNLTFRNNGVLVLEVAMDSSGAPRWDHVTANSVTFEVGSVIRIVVSPDAFSNGRPAQISFVTCLVSGGCDFLAASFEVIGDSPAGLQLSADGLSFAPAPVPEPRTWLLMLLGGACLAGTSLWKRRLIARRPNRVAVSWPASAGA